MNSHDLSFFFGHFVPGTSLVLIAIWWMINIFKGYFTALHTDTRVVPRLYFLGPCCQFPVESILKCIMLIGSVINEIHNRYAYDDARVQDLQHVTMYVALGLLGVLELLHHNRFSIPVGAVRAAFLLFVATTTVTFAFHEMPDAPLRNNVHKLLLYVNAALGVVTVLEMQDRKSVIPALGRCYLMLLQGTWFLQLAVYSSNPSQWDQRNHDHQMYFVLFFMWHLIINFVIALIVGSFVKSVVGSDKTESSGIGWKNNPYAPLSECQHHEELFERRLKPMSV